MIREERFSFVSSEGKAKIQAVRWMPEGRVKAVAQMVHGMAEYIGRYRAFAEYLAKQGILAVGHDHLGHGDSASSPEEYGYFAEKDGNKCMLQDIHRVTVLVKKEYPDVPYILFGHSMGSFLVRQYLCVYGRELDGAVICGTGCYPAAAAGLGMCVAAVQAHLHGWEYRSRLLGWLTTGRGNKSFAPNRTESDWLCRDERVVDEYIRDERCGFLFTVNGYYNMFLGLFRIAGRAYLKRMPKALPVLFIAGECDPVGGFGKGVSRVAKQFVRLGMEDVQCRLYPKDRHEILNELDKEQVYADVAEWITGKCLQKRTPAE